MCDINEYKTFRILCSCSLVCEDSKGKGPTQDPNVVTGMFLLNGFYASVLFDTGADFSFISVDFKRALGLKTSKLGIKYAIEHADGKNIETYYHP